MATAFPSIELPAAGYRRILTVNVQQIRRGDLGLERIFRSGHIRHSFEIAWPFLTPAEQTVIAAFFASCRGRYLRDIQFTDPFDDEVYVCRFDQDELELTAPDALYFTGKLRLTEASNWKPLKPAVTIFPPTVPVLVPVAAARKYRTVIEPHEDEFEQVFEDYQDATGIQSWTAGGAALTEDEFLDLAAAWEGNAGPYQPMTFTDPVTGVAYTSHFAEAQLEHAIAFDLHSCKVKIEELK